MCASASEPGDPVRQSQPAPDRGALPNETTPDRDLFERVLDATRAVLGTGDQLSAAELEALREVARRRRGSALAVEPVMVELVQSVLRHRFLGLWKHDTLWAAMSRQIAETLLEDPPSRQRLDLFWTRLCETA